MASFALLGSRNGKPGPARLFDRRCRGNCTLPSLQVLPMGGTPGLVATGNLSTALGGTISTTRASTRSCTQLDGGLATLANDTPCVEPTGLVVEPGVTNLALRSGALQTSPWADGTNSALSTDTLAMWRMDDSGGTTVNATGTQDLTKYGAGTAASISGVVSNARTTLTNASFLSSTAVAQAVITQLATGTHSESLWVRPASDAVTSDVLENQGLNWGGNANDMFVVRVDYDAPNQQLLAYSCSNTACNTSMPSGASSVPKSAWTHYAHTMEAPDGGNRLVKQYINGALVGTYWRPSPTLTPTGNHYWGIGAYTDIGGVGTPASQFHGDFDDVRVFNVVLSPTDIAGMVDAGVSRITATANQATARDGTVTAATLAFPGVPNRQRSVWTQTFTGTAAIYTAAVDVQAVSGTPTLYLSLNNGSTYYRNSCTPNTSSLTRCSVSSSANLTAATWTFQVGVDTGDSSQAVQPAQSVYVSEAQIESFGAATSYIPTTGSTATRSGELVLTGPVYLPGTQYSLSGDFTPEGFASASGDILNINTDSGEEVYVKLNSTGGANTMDCGALAGGAGATTTSATFTSGTQSHFSCSYDGANLKACIGTTCTTAAKSFTRSVSPYARAFLLGDTLLTGRPTVPGHLSNLCVDPSPYRCQ